MRRGGLIALGVTALLALPAASASAARVNSDFDGDGKADLAIDAEGQTVAGHTFAGAVQVLYGSRHGPSGARDRIFTEDTPHVPQAAGDYDDFGVALATGHFNGDRFADLAIGSPFKDVNGAANAGSVTILYGSRHGLRSRGSRLLLEGANGLPGSITAYDNFGWSLAAANLGRGRQDDLAIGAPRTAVNSQAEAGVVDVVYGSVGGLRANHSRQFSQDTPQVKDQSEASDQFGFSLASANFGRSPHADLAIGTRYQSVSGAASAGSVNVLYGSLKGLRTKGNQFFTQDTPGVRDTAEANDYFGWGLAAANFGHNNRADLAIGVPLEEVAGAQYAGAANVLYGSRRGLKAKGSQFLTQTGLGTGDGSEENDGFGYSLAGANFGRGNRADLAVGVPYECPGPGMCPTYGGEVDVIYGSHHGLSAAGAEGFNQDTPGVEDFAEGSDTFGWAVAAGRFRGTKVNDLAIGIPLEGVVSIDDQAGAVSVLRGSAGGIVTANDLFLTQGSGGLDGTAEPQDEFGVQLSGPNSTVVFD